MVNAIFNVLSLSKLYSAYQSEEGELSYPDCAVLTDFTTDWRELHLYVLIARNKTLKPTDTFIT